MKNDLWFPVSLGATAGAVEAALRSGGSHGWSAGQSAAFVVLSVGLSVGVALGLAGVARVFAEPTSRRRAVAGALFGAVAAVAWRYEFALNERVVDPRVWAGVPAAFVAGAALGAVVAPRLSGPRLGVVTLIALGVAGFRSRQAHGLASSPDHPNVLVISLDTVRADHVGGKPTWVRLAAEGSHFTQAIAAAPITEPSHLAMFTGIAPFRSGLVSNGTHLGDRALVWKEFRAAGYVVGGFVAGFPLHGKYGWSQGTDVWDDDFGAWPGAQSLTWVKAWNQVALKEHAIRERSAAGVVKRAGAWLAAHRGERFFAFVHFYDAHGPYVSAMAEPPPTDGAALALPRYWPEAARAVTSVEWLKRAYDAEVATADAAMGQVIASLGDALDHTIVVVTADHGESLGEHGVLFDHGDDLYDPSLRVPLLVRWPGHVRAGASLDCQVGGVDLAPTLRELAGLPNAPGGDGISRAQELREGGCRAVPVVSSTTSGRFVEAPPVDHALRGLGTKLILKPSGAVEHYQLDTDPGELRSVSPPDGQVAAFLSLLAGGASVASPAADEETRRALEALGYVEVSP